MTEEKFACLANARCVIVGTIAMVLHGYLQFTQGVSVVVPENETLACADVDVHHMSAAAFDELWARAVIVSIGRRELRVAEIADLIAMKRSSDDLQDAADVAALELLLDVRNGAADDWPATFDGVRREQIRGWMSTTIDQRLEWLEEMRRFVAAART